jgi:hypothetical protein
MSDGGIEGGVNFSSRELCVEEKENMRGRKNEGHL